MEQHTSDRSVSRRSAAISVVVSFTASAACAACALPGAAPPAGRAPVGSDGSDNAPRSATPPEPGAVGSPSATDSPAISFASGQRIEEYAEAVALVASGIDPQQFLELARRGRFSYDFLASKPASASLEGYLLPGTYRVLPGQTTAETLMRQLLTRFGESFPPALRAQAKQTAGLDVHQAVILASIVERAALPAERQPLAADYVDRLRRGECLCADVTLRYALGKPGDWWPALPAPAQSVLRESPYNSHVHHTLPPGPICNPSADTLRAVAAPVRAGP